MSKSQLQNNKWQRRYNLGGVAVAVAPATFRASSGSSATFQISSAQLYRQVIPRIQRMKLHCDSGQIPSTMLSFILSNIILASTLPAADEREMPLVFPHIAQFPFFLFIEIYTTVLPLLWNSFSIQYFTYQIKQPEQQAASSILQQLLRNSIQARRLSILQRVHWHPDFSESWRHCQLRNLRQAVKLVQYLLFMWVVRVQDFTVVLLPQS